MNLEKLKRKRKRIEMYKKNTELTVTDILKLKREVNSERYEKVQS